MMDSKKEERSLDKKEERRDGEKIGSERKARNKRLMKGRKGQEGRQGYTERREGGRKR